MSFGIYQICCLPTGKLYIGKSVYGGGMEDRWKQHQRDLRKNRHGNRFLQAAWNHHGEVNFSFNLLLECSKSEAAELEMALIKLFGSDNPKYGFNLTPGGDGNTMLNEATRAKQKRSQNAPAFRKWRSAHLSKLYSTSAYRELFRKQTTQLHQNPITKAKHKASMKKAYSNPELRAQNSEMRKQEWAIRKLLS